MIPRFLILLFGVVNGRTLHHPNHLTTTHPLPNSLLRYPMKKIHFDFVLHFVPIEVGVIHFNAPIEGTWGS